MAKGESDFKADELDSIINVIGLRPNDPLDGFGGKILFNPCPAEPGYTLPLQTV